MALFLTLAWIYVLYRSERSLYRSVLYWACGATLVWGLVMTLWLSWIDYGKSYQAVARSLSAAVRQHAPPGKQCIQSSNLGQSQRAAFDYHAGIMTVRLEIEKNPRCAMLLVQAHPNDDDRRLSPHWRRIWEGSRPRDRERYRLYLRTPSANPR